MGEGVTVVFGGGGVWGIGWLSGLAAGLARAGVDLSEAGRMIGTSAGSVVAAQLAVGWSAEALYERHVHPAQQTSELVPDPAKLGAIMALATRPGLSREDRLHEMCALARTAETVPPKARRDTIVARLGRGEDPAWPAKLVLTAVDRESEELVALDAASGIALVDGIAASCASPGLWPPVAANGRFYLDGGIWRTPDNAHLAAGVRAALVISPMAGVPGLGEGLAAEIAGLEADGVKVAVITADQAALATMGSDPLDPATRGPAAEGGLRQAAEAAAAAAEILAAVD
jgi:NTE family protein